MEDITLLFSQSCQGLATGRMIKPAELTMLDAMNAIQLLDAKMDSGMIIQSAMSPVRFDPEAPLCVEDVCWVMDRMMALEVAWYRGATLCQSVYTGLYYHNPQHLAGPSRYPQQEQQTYLMYLVLRSYVLLYCKTIDLAYSEFAKNHVYDGEDCWLDHYGVAVRMSDPIEDVVSLTDEALVWLESEQCDISTKWREQLIKRLVFRRAAFDPTMPSHLRQSMPLPATEHIEIGTAWQVLSAGLDDLVALESLVQDGTWNQWDSRFDLVSNRLFDGGLHGNDLMALATINRESSKNPAILRDFGEVTSELGPAACQQISVWKNLVSGVLHAIRLDCLIESNLASLDLDMATPLDETELWWWMSQVASERAICCPLSSTWQSSWAKVWASMASAVQIEKTLLQDATRHLVEAIERLDHILEETNDCFVGVSDFY
ncbi:uncharacterized protein IL334_006690 [Kwoniella shivajii]|uniref:NAA35-like N-terminal domain-containing protein n=1 Tax=Kwoniella shivajii TaxID=564305 RepID=A0ABZ1D6M9_9TREE|nr:hypothetical protein IL334_006690 [Kwoniella shivajii]